jgi:hypothetical protein
MYTLAHSGNPTRRIAAGRYGEDNDAIETPRKPSPPPCPYPVSLRLGTKRRQSTGDFQPATSAVPRIISDDCEDQFTSSSHEQQDQQTPQDQKQVQREGIVNPLFFHEPGSPPKTIHCDLSLASSISDISVNEPEWVFEGSSSGSESNLVPKDLVSAQDWEGIILAVSRPEYEKEELRTHPSKSREEWPGEAILYESTGEQDDMKYRRQRGDGGNTSGIVYRTDPLSDQEILGHTFHTQLLPPQRKLSPPPKNTVTMDVDLRAINAKSLSGRRSNCFSADTAPIDNIFPQESALKSHEDVTPSTTTTTLCASLHEETQVPELSSNYSPDGCDHFEAPVSQLRQEGAFLYQEMCVADMSDEEMLLMALQASKEEYEEWKQIVGALEESSIEGLDVKEDNVYPAEEKVKNDQIISYSLEALLVLPIPQRPPELPKTQRQRRVGVIPILLRRHRGGRKSPSTA